MSEDARNTLARIRALRERQDRLLDELERSLALRTLWPDVFAFGRVTSHVTGHQRSRYGLYMVVERSDGQTRRFPLADLPKVLMGGWRWDQRERQWMAPGEAHPPTGRWSKE